MPPHTPAVIYSATPLFDRVKSAGSQGFVVLDAEERIVLVNEADRRLYAEIADLMRPVSVWRR